MRKKIKALIDYFGYVVRHKFEVAKLCFHEGLYLQGVLHDWTKFLPDEYIPFAYKFKWPSEKTPEENNRIKTNFKCARDKHFRRNRHHWKHWVLDEQVRLALEMPDEYLIEMICDWKAIGIVKGDSARGFYEKDSHKIILGSRTKSKLETILGINKIK